MFAIYGTPKRIESDNGVPFNLNDFEEFARQEGFQHHKVTPRHPRTSKRTNREQPRGHQREEPERDST